MIEVTSAAGEAIAAFMKEKELDSPFRVFLESGGCGGPSLRLVLDEKKDGDEEFEIGGLTYLIAKDLSEKSGKVTVDFVDNGWQQGFSLESENPMGDPSEGDCGGCGGGCG
jgi:iron-sulfur cluster assembly protein